MSERDDLIYEWVAIFSDVATELGLEHSITSVVRTREKQTQIFESRRGTNLPAARPGASTHEYGLAFDVAAVRSADQGKLGQLGEALGLYWGGRFRQRDPWHFQVVDPKLWSSLFR